MTVCVCVKVHECMVFAADSATSYDGAGLLDGNGDPIQQVYRHGNKIFQLHREKPIMAMTAGMGNFGKASIAMLAKEFRQVISNSGSAPLGNDYAMQDVVYHAHRFFLEEKFRAAQQSDATLTGSFELWIGGYSHNSDFPELWKISIFRGEVQEAQQIAGPEEVGIYPGGQPDPIMRLVNGFGFRLEGVLMQHGVTPKSHPDLYKNVAPALFLPLMHPAMPIQDTIDLAEFLAEMTKKVFRFRAVPEYVSGDIDVASVTKYEKFRWIKRKHYYPAPLNREVDHV